MKFQYSKPSGYNNKSPDPILSYVTNSTNIVFIDENEININTTIFNSTVIFDLLFVCLGRGKNMTAFNLTVKPVSIPNNVEKYRDYSYYSDKINVGTLITNTPLTTYTPLVTETTKNIPSQPIPEITPKNNQTTSIDVPINKSYMSTNNSNIIIIFFFILIIIIIMFSFSSFFLIIKRKHR